MDKIVFFIIAILISACQEKKIGTPSKIETTLGISAIYLADKTSSTSIWSIEKNDSQQQFSIPIATGRISVLEGVVTTGDIELDILGLKSINLKNDLANIFEKTLRDTSFFDATNFPMGRMIIKKIEKTEQNPNVTHHFSVDCTLKNITKTIDIPVLIQINNDEITLESQPFSISLLEWDIISKDKITQCKINLSLKAKKQVL
jgi:polyisoprenoid-binding protein YceI